MIQSTVSQFSGGERLPAQTSSLPTQAYGVQTKLKVSQPGDAQELEADRVAQDVMDADSGSGAPTLQRKCAACEGDDRRPGTTVQRQAQAGLDADEGESDEDVGGVAAKLIQRQADRRDTEENEEEIDSTIPRKASPAAMSTANSATSAASGPTPASRIGSVMRQSGQPLSADVRTSLEPHFGAKLGGVRVHTDSGAAQSAHAIGARAFTLGRNIVFNNGEFQPHSQTGRRLLAHELTHVRQQGGL